MKQNIQMAKVPFTMIANVVLNDKSLSWKAKGLFAYLYSKPETYSFSFKRIAEDSSDGERAVRTALQELERLGYLLREKQHDGRTLYYLNFEPGGGFSNLPKRQLGETATISKIDTTQSNTDTETKIDIATDVADVNKVLNAFKLKLNQFINFGNKTQRKAASDLIKEMGLPAVLKSIDFAASILGEQFAPVITTPYQLREKMAQLFSYTKKQEKVPKERKYTPAQEAHFDKYGFYPMS